MKRTTLCLTLTAIMLSAWGAHADILWFKNGRSLEGTVRELPGGKVEITLPYGTLAFSKAQVVRVEQAVSISEIVDQALATLKDGDVDKLFELAEWCREKKEYTLAQRLYQQVLAQDPDHDGARQRLGFELQHGTWMTEEEARIARGEVPFRGRWVSLAERERFLREERIQEHTRRLADLEEARFALEASRVELEAERLRSLPPPNGLPIYGISSVYVPPFGSAYPGSAAPGRRDSTLPGAERGTANPEPHERRHTGSVPPHRRGGFVVRRR